MKKINKKCDCDNLQNGSIITQDKDGKCVVCGRVYGELTDQQVRDAIEVLKSNNTNTLQVYCFDLDGTLCTVEKGPLGLKDYANAVPKMDRIAVINTLYDQGHLIKIETARGAQTDQDWKEFTEKQLKEWGLKYHVLRVGVKMHANWYIDDKGINDKDFFNI